MEEFLGIDLLVRHRSHHNHHFVLAKLIGDWNRRSFTHCGESCDLAFHFKRRNILATATNSILEFATRLGRELLPKRRG